MYASGTVERHGAAVIFPTHAALALVLAWCGLALVVVFVPVLSLPLWLAAAVRAPRR